MAEISVNTPRMPYVTFDKVAVENRTKTIEAGHYVADDVVYAFVTPAGSKDRVERVYDDWIKQLRREVSEGRFPEDWLAAVERRYDSYMKGEELPETGTPIKNWPPISKAQLETLKSAGIYTVEALAEATEEAVGRMGMGGRALQNLARTWVEESKTTGKAAAKLEAAQVELEAAKARIADLEGKLAASQAQVKELQASAKK